jgi:hypothetical protein
LKNTNCSVADRRIRRVYQSYLLAKTGLFQQARSFAGTRRRKHRQKQIFAPRRLQTYVIKQSADNSWRNSFLAQMRLVIQLLRSAEASRWKWRQSRALNIDRKGVIFE